MPCSKCLFFDHHDGGKVWIRHVDIVRVPIEMFRGSKPLDAVQQKPNVGHATAGEDSEAACLLAFSNGAAATIVENCGNTLISCWSANEDTVLTSRPIAVVPAAASRS
jgi:hypothetical protein